MRAYQIVKEQMPASPPQSSYVRAQEEDPLILLIQRPWPLTVHAKKRYSFMVGVLNNLLGLNCPKYLCHKDLTLFRFVDLLRLGSFRVFSGAVGWLVGKLGSFCIIWCWKSRRDASGTVNWVRFAVLPGRDWVRFAYLGRGTSWGRRKLGSFRIFGTWARVGER